MKGSTGRRLRRAAVTAIATSMLVAGLQPARAGAPKASSRVGVLIVDHGEPPEYNEFTYWSFRRFFDHLMDMGAIPPWLRALDAGTVLQDENCYGCAQPATDGTFIDAWLKPHNGPAAYVPGSDSLPAHYVVPGGPGAGEPDIFEHFGLAAWHEWQLMGGRSPNYEEKLPKKKAVIRRLRARYGSDLPIRTGYGIDPRIGGAHQGLRQAVTGLVNRDRVDHIAVVYHGVGFSDIMQTHMIRHEIATILSDVAPKTELTYAKPIGTTRSYVNAVVDKVRRELARLPERAPVAVHLSGHGLPTDMCGDYDCGSDSYHKHSKRLFERTRRALLHRIDRKGRVGFFHLYGEGGTEDDDPEDRVDSPIEALDERRKAGFRHVIDVPYEFDSNSRDTLIILRRGYERSIPDWNHRFESHFKYKGMHVKITDCSYGNGKKTDALEEVALRALEKAGKGKGGGGHHHH